jgi:NNP family nitrate/nitrite transporter-like MFS transporter
VVGEFHTRSLARYVMFNLLNLSAVMVIFGATLALRRRLRDPGSRARQQFGNDIVPLLLLIAISATGLMLTLSTHLLDGYAYAAISLIHAFVVTGTLLYLPFGKLFHVLQRPAQLGVALYRRANEASPLAACRVCHEGFAGAMHVSDLKNVLGEVDLEWTWPGPAAHYAEVCPRCRRRLFGFTQGRLWGRTA